MSQSDSLELVVMAGGSGSRLWPLSRALYPKQFLALLDEGSMLQETLKRVSGLPSASATIICNEEHRFIVAEQIRQMGQSASILLEPEGKNTAPAVALAALGAKARGQDPVLLVLAADHAVTNPEAFVATIEKAMPMADSGKLVTFGVVARYPETGYGYIKAASASGEPAEVLEFVEKPDAATAESYVQSGNYYWNSGMFLFKASRYLEELGKHRPDILSACEAAMAEPTQDMDFTRINAKAFADCPEDSIDYAVMEKTDSAWVVPLDAGWSDVGSWSSLWDVTPRDSDGNVCKGDVIAEDTKGSYINATSRLVATLGVDDLVVVETTDAVLVSHKERVQDVKKIVKRLKESDRSEHLLHREVYRPWGKYDSIDNGQRYQVKRITVKPGERLSIQMHHHRAEHWVVVAGTAKVRRGDDELMLAENESVYIPVGVIHSLENPGKIPLELIEVQSGSYLGEDDIVRFDDRYGRS